MSRSERTSRPAGGQAGWNDPCPCGSGREFKSCCGVAVVPPPPANLSEAGQASDAFGRFPPASLPSEPTPLNGDASQRSHHAKIDLARGRDLLIAGRAPNAIAPLRRAVALDPGNAGAHHDLGLAYLLCERLPEAIASLSTSVALQPDHFRARFNLATALKRRGHDDAAIAECRAAVRLAPQFAEGHGKLGDLLRAQGRREEAAACFRQAAAVSPNSVIGRLNHAKALVADGRIDEAVVWIGRMRARDSDDAAAQSQLGDLLAAIGRFDEAIACFERVIALDPQHAMAQYALICAKQITETDRPLLARAEAQLANGLPERRAIALHFALGKAYDDLAEFAAAMRHFDAANSLRHRNAAFPFRRAVLAQRVEQTRNRFTRDFFRQHAGLGLADETPLLILGMPRSGTTLVEQIVSSHPAVAAGGELGFWTNRLSEWEASWTQAPGEAMTAAPGKAYVALLRQNGPHAARVTDKMPTNFFAAGLIHLLLPRARIIHCLRNPIDTCLSIYMTPFSGPFPWASDREDLVFYYRQYERLMQHWRAVLPADRFMEVEYEELVGNPQTTTRRLIAFCGLDWDDACLAPERNPRTVATASKWQARQPIYTGAVARWRRYEPWLGALRELLSGADTGDEAALSASAGSGQKPLASPQQDGRQ